MKRLAVLATAIVAVLMLIYTFVPGEPGADRSWTAKATTYSPGPSGAKALFLLLSEMGLEVGRLRRPGYESLSPRDVLWVLTREPFGRAERRELVGFLRKGGTLIAPPQSLAVVLQEARLGEPELKEQSSSLETRWRMKLELPEPPASIAGVATPAETYATAAPEVPVVAAWKVGAGRAVSLGIDRLSRNDLIGRSGNGPFLARLALELGRKHVFDEFKTGYGEGSLLTLLTRAPYRWAVAQLALVGALGLVAFARRRLPAEPPAPFRRRATIDHVDAVARLWEQARDAGLPLQAILSATEERARARLGGSGGERPFPEWIERVRPDLASRAGQVWDRAVSLSREDRPSTEDARRVAVDLKTLEREGRKW